MDSDVNNVPLLNLPSRFSNLKDHGSVPNQLTWLNPLYPLPLFMIPSVNITNSDKPLLGVSNVNLKQFLIQLEFVFLEIIIWIIVFLPRILTSVNNVNLDILFLLENVFWKTLKIVLTIWLILLEEIYYVLNVTLDMDSIRISVLRISLILVWESIPSMNVFNVNMDSN